MSAIVFSPRTLVDSYRKAAKELAEWKSVTFQSGAIVEVNHPRCHSYGLVEIKDGTPTDKLAVKLENGNVWWYEVECCRLTTKAEWLSLPRSIKRMKRSWNWFNGPKRRSKNAR